MVCYHYHIQYFYLQCIPTRTFNTRKFIEISTCELKIEKRKMIITTKISSHTAYISDSNNKKTQTNSMQNA